MTAFAAHATAHALVARKGSPNMVLRQKVWIDFNVQGVLVGRILLYWFGVALYFGISLSCYQWMEYPELTTGENIQAIFEQIWPCLPSYILLLPLVIFDMVRLSNRFVGPVYRLRMHLGRLNANASTYALNFRDDDYWQQLAEPINQLQRTILSLEKEVARLTKEQAAAQAIIDARPKVAKEPAQPSPKSDRSDRAVNDAAGIDHIDGIENQMSGSLLAEQIQSALPLASVSVT